MATPRRRALRVVRAEADPATGHALWRAGRDTLFQSHLQSPLPPVDPLRCTGLPYWPYNPELRFELPVLSALDASHSTKGVETNVFE